MCRVPTDIHAGTIAPECPRRAHTLTCAVADSADTWGVARRDPRAHALGATRGATNPRNFAGIAAVAGCSLDTCRARATTRTAGLARGARRPRAELEARIAVDVHTRTRGGRTVAHELAARAIVSAGRGRRREAQIGSQVNAVTPKREEGIDRERPRDPLIGRLIRRATWVVEKDVRGIQADGEHRVRRAASNHPVRGVAALGVDHHDDGPPRLELAIDQLEIASDVGLGAVPIASREGFDRPQGRIHAATRVGTGVVGDRPARQLPHHRIEFGAVTHDEFTAPHARDGHDVVGGIAVECRAVAGQAGRAARKDLRGPRASHADGGRRTPRGITRPRGGQTGGNRYSTTARVSGRGRGRARVEAGVERELRARSVPEASLSGLAVAILVAPSGGGGEPRR
jgi:hypothetical protein